MGTIPEPGGALLDRLAAAVNSHDLDALEDCFAPGYRNQTPAHPAQGFTGRGQVRRNWEQIFTFVPDITARVLRRRGDLVGVGDDRHPPGRYRAPNGRGDRVRRPRRALHLGPVLPGTRAGGRAGRQRGGAPTRPARRRPRAGPEVIVVAGGTGTLGTRLVPRLAEAGLTVRVLTRDPARAGHLAGPGVEVVHGDVRDPARVARALRGAGTVISAVHGFAGPGGVSPASVDRAGNAHLVAAAARTGAAFVLVSVVGASSGHPIGLFRAKHAAEQTLRASGIPWTIVRATAFIETWATIMARPPGPDSAAPAT